MRKLIVTLIFCLLTWNVFAQSIEVGEEIVSQRFERAKVFKLSNGQRRAVFHGKPIHYKNGKGEWEDIDIDLAETPTAFVVSKNKVKAHFRRDRKFHRYISLRYDAQHQLDLSLASIELDGVEKVQGEEFGLIQRQMKGKVSHVLSSGVEVITELNEVSSRGFVKVDVVIGDFKIAEELHLRGLTCSNTMSDGEYEPDEFGRFNFLDEHEELMFWIPPPLAMSADGEIITEIEHALTELPGLRLVYAKHPTAQGQLELASAAYPLLIDTDVFFSTTADGYVYHKDEDWDIVHDATTGTSAATGDMFYSKSISSYWDTQNSWIYIYRSFFYFDTSALPDACEVTSAVLKIYGYSLAESDVVAQKGTQADTLVAGDYDSFSGSEYAHVTWAIDQYNSISFNATGKSEINKTGTTKICCREYDHDYLDSTSGTSNYRNGCWFANTPGTDSDPKLEVDYEMPAGQIIIVSMADKSKGVEKRGWD